jgi:hypothetical protein
MDPMDREQAEHEGAEERQLDEPTPAQSLGDDEIETQTDDPGGARIREEDDDIGEGMDWPGW